MSPWTHAMCLVCWMEHNRGREPIVVLDADPEPCCFCGRMTDAGIYVRADPADLACTHERDDG